MPTTVKFETATIADALKNADKVAPSKGSAFDEAGGIVIDIDPGQSVAVIRATNRDIFLTEWVNALEVTGDPVTWRLPSSMLVPFVASLPIGSGKETVFTDDGVGPLLVSSGKTKAKMFRMDHSTYPEWDVFDPDGLSTVTDLGGKTALVEWAAGRTEQPPFTGVHFDGEHIRATDRYKVVRVPLRIENMPVPVTLPAGIIGQILRQTGDVRMGFTENQVLLMPNDTTQIRAVIYDEPYPAMTKIMDTVRPDVVKVSKAQLVDSINRAAIAAGGDRLPTLSIHVGKESVVVVLKGHESSVQDEIEVLGQATHPRVEIRLTPRFLLDTLNNAPGETVNIHYDQSDPSRVLYIEGASGYEGWVVCRKANEA